MPITIITTGLIFNELPEGNLENREFQYSIDFIEAGQIVTKQFSLINAPGELIINPLTAVITGNIKSLDFNGFLTGSQKYPEYDYREYTDVRPPLDKYQIPFTVMVQGTETIGPAVVPYMDQKPVILEVIKDQSVNVLLHQNLFLDGSSRQPYTCLYGEPANEQQCTNAGGIWLADHCTVNIPNNSSDCSNAGGLWENGKCNMQMCQDKNQCESIGHVWTKNIIHDQSSFSQFLQNNDFEKESIEIYNEVK